MAEDKKKATSSESSKQTVQKTTMQPAKKTINREDVAKIAASAKKAATTVRKAAKNSVHQTAVAIIKVQDATKKRRNKKRLNVPLPQKTPMISR